MTDRELMQRLLDTLLQCEPAYHDDWRERDLRLIALNAAIAALRDRLARPEAVPQAEPVAWMMSEEKQSRYPQMRQFSAHSAGVWDIPLYTHPAPAVPLTDEQDRALCEAHCNDATDEYFNARPQLDSAANRRIFYAGHRKGWLARTIEAAHGIRSKT